MSKVEERAQELIVDAAKEVIAIEEKINEHKETIKDIKSEVKSEGINIKALNNAIKRYKAYLEGKNEVENDLDEADIYLEVLKEELV